MADVEHYKKKKIQKNKKGAYEHRLAGAGGRILVSAVFDWSEYSPQKRILKRTNTLALACGANRILYWAAQSPIIASRVWI